MKPLTILSILFSTFILISCKKESEQVTTNITNQKDYNNFLEIKENKSIDFAKAEIAFWQKKYDAAPNQISFLNQIATNYSILFEQSAKIEYLYKTEELLIKSNEALKYSNTGAIRSLARNYITQHRFKEALVLANKALAIGDGMFETQKLLFDVQMELGNYTEADKALTKIKNFKDFDYLLRLAKWNDHKGDSKSAINLMEKAKEQVLNIL